MPRYSAFISYCHSDRRFAARLQRSLESFRIPAATVRRLELDSNRLGRVFRDVSDLGAAHELTGALKSALADSKALLVICSPGAVRSAWVGQEIVEFRRIHGLQAHILCIIAPDAGEAKAEELFHPALGASAPLAADARKEGEGRRIALLKVVAGLLGTGLDELIQRDTRRRHARLIAGITTTAAIALAMTVLAGFALSAREDAKRRLSQSEDLIGFMLNDLRAQLVPLGQVGILKSVGDQALTYFESLEDSDLTEAALLRKSRALYQIGDVYFELGEFAAAHESFGISLEQARLLAAAQPENSERLFELSQAEFWVGYAAWYAGDLDTAESHLEAYDTAAWKLHTLDPGNPDWMMETFWASNNLGSLAFRRAHFQAALEHFLDAILRIDQLIEQEATPTRLYERASTRSWLASTYFRLGQLDSSAEAFRQALDEPLDPDNALHIEERAYFHGKLAAIHIHRGDLDKAREHARAAVKLASGLAASDPGSMELMYTKAAQDLVRSQIDFYERQSLDYPNLDSTAGHLLAADNPPPKWYVFALDTANLGLRANVPGSIERAEQLLARGLNAEDTGNDEARAKLDLLATLADLDPSSTERLSRLVAQIERQLIDQRDFALAMPLYRGCTVLELHECAEAMRAVLLKAGSRHPDFKH